MSLTLRLHFNEENEFFSNAYIGKTFVDIADAVYVPVNGDFISFSAADYVLDEAVANKLQQAMDERGSFRARILGVNYEKALTVVDVLLFSDENYLKSYTETE
ncbi:hypothetical protein [Mucilaginibacter sp. 44-25]|uniref:hypothetical protein n=1 Tax=Mucilaginibacter sp. 44-25 TaxID=1895794 RepID=UPI0009680BC1|nr:hypothetical protein [Mucilaginibacter sp. 44-25]OJW12498.1 MAG: hypothetical protein BGO48_05230 [Mucilaginibacter sp. 44-25]